MNLQKKMLKHIINVCLPEDETNDDPYHITLTFAGHSEIGYIHLIAANSDTPEIEAFEINENYRNYGYGKKLILNIPKFYKYNNLPLKAIRVKPCGTDQKKLSQKEVEEIYKKLSVDLYQKFKIKLIIYH